MASVQEVKNWLKHAKLDDQWGMLAANGYDDLDAISQCTPAELKDFEGLFPAEDRKQNIRRLVLALQRVSLAEYRSRKSTKGVEQFKKLLEGPMDALYAPMEEKALLEANQPAPQPVAVKEPEPAPAPKPAPAPAPVAAAKPAAAAAAAPAPKPPAPAPAKAQEKSPEPAPAPASAAPVLGPDGEESWDEIIRETGVARARAGIHEIYAEGRVSKIVPAADVGQLLGSYVSTRRVATATEGDKRLKQLLQFLLAGDPLKKVKKGVVQKAKHYWVSPLLDYLIWGDSDRANVKSFTLIKDIKAVERKGKLLTLTIAKKASELEADTDEKATAWAEAFQFLIKSWNSEAAERKAYKANADFGKELDACKEEHIKLTTEGDVFKKWPGRNAAAGSASVRKLWIERTKREEKICWGDVGTNKVKGYLPLEDVVQVFEEPDDPDNLKFSIVCVGKALDLESRTPEIRAKWIRALRFFVAERKL